MYSKDEFSRINCEESGRNLQEYIESVGEMSLEDAKDALLKLYRLRNKNENDIVLSILRAYKGNLLDLMSSVVFLRASECIR